MHKQIIHRMNASNFYTHGGAWAHLNFVICVLLVKYLELSWRMYATETNTEGNTAV